MSSQEGSVPHTKSTDHQLGFTIVELLIATAVFAMVLVIVTSGILQVADTFFKGDTESNTQQVTATVMDTISQAVQFNGGSVVSILGASPADGDTLCIGNEKFSYWPGYQLVASNPNSTEDQTNAALIENSTTSGCVGSPSTTGRELLSDDMRLSNLSVQCISSATLCGSTTTGGQLYQIDIRVVYGNDNLLLNPTATDASCNGAVSGQQFCAVSDVSTVVAERI